MEVEKNYIRYINDIEIRRQSKNSPYCKFAGKSNNIVRCIDRSAELLISFLDLCKVGDGQLYEHFVLDAIGKILTGIVDCDEVLLHGHSQGGYYDIEFAFCTEMLPEYPFWKPWYDRYGIKSVIVEAKNMQYKATVEHVRQLKDYLEGTKKGSFGILVSRNGFKKNALIKLRAYADDHNTLILPITHHDLKVLLSLSIRGAFDVYKFLCVKETRLLRVR